MISDQFENFIIYWFKNITLLNTQKGYSKIYNNKIVLDFDNILKSCCNVGIGIAEDENAGNILFNPLI